MKRNYRLIGLVTIGFIMMVGVVGVLGYQLGQSSVNVNSPSAVLVEAIDAPTPQPPPMIVTNTPTPQPSATPTFGPTNTPTTTPTATPIAVLNKVAALGRLETTEFAMQTVIDLADDPDNLWENIFGADSIVLVAEGEVVAGIDLSKIGEGDIKVEGTNIIIVLPETEILYSRLDNKKSYVYERGAGFLVQPDVDLEGQARQLAEERLTKWAIERGIHDQAEKSAQLQIENLLLSLGFKQITILFNEEPL